MQKGWTTYQIGYWSFVKSSSFSGDDPIIIKATLCVIGLNRTFVFVCKKSYIVNHPNKYSFMPHSKLSGWNESWNNFFPASVRRRILPIFCLCSHYECQVHYNCHKVCMCSAPCNNICIFDLWNLLGRNKAITIFFLSVMNQVGAI